MKILIAEDDPVSRRVLEATLARWGHDAVVLQDGTEALAALTAKDAPALAILDWMMPGIDGIEVVKRVRAAPSETPPYLILLTAKQTRDDVMHGLDAGANDYVTKPFHHGELKARLQVGMRTIELQQSLAQRIKELADARAREKRLEGLLPICSYCKKIRDDANYWRQVETFVEQHSEAQFTHSICPDCFSTKVKPQLAELARTEPPPPPPPAPP